MKKLLLNLFVILLLLALLTSCNVDNTDNVSGESTDEATEADTETDTDTNADVAKPLLPYEKYGNKVYFAYEEKDVYYPEIESYEEIENCFEIPTDDDGYKKSGAYLKVIGSYDELLTYIIPTELDSDVFKENYVVCIKQNFSGGVNKKIFVGYYDLKKQEDQYSICLDHYESILNSEMIDEEHIYEYTNYVIVPKQSIEYVEQIQKIEVNGKNDITDDFVMPISHLFINHKSYNDLSNPTSWIVKRGSELEKQYGFEYFDKYSGVEYRAILYLPSEPSCDFMITEKEIKNGNLYLTVELYERYTNEYLSKNDVRFYDLYIQDTSELCENYDVYILVKTVK